ncbi:MAG: hypothetical protein HZB70_01855 [Candidatus Berkelbacteria bacterium]|nr:MAG: hypothetical protein HZB70_01855 [Candidatus Berkelbacteria bacterium]QQG51932.1 MAG: hypothetical protein HY845_01140 [Candidatus Berkelbacteria bacterium]
MKRAASLSVILLGILGLVLVNSQQVSAQSSDYTTKWDANSLIVGTLHRPITGNSEGDCVNGTLLGNYGDPAGSEIAFGINQWTVKGRITGSTKFKEVWSAPQLPYAYTYGGTWNGSCQNLKLIVSGNNSMTDWLMGYISNETYTRSVMAFRSVGISQGINNKVNVDVSRADNIGKTTSCQRQNNCLYATGGYGWTAAHEIDDAHAWKPINVGILMPLKWTISGDICDGGDTRCD